MRYTGTSGHERAVLLPETQLTQMFSFWQFGTVWYEMLCSGCGLPRWHCANCHCPMLKSSDVGWPFPRHQICKISNVDTKTPSPHFSTPEWRCQGVVTNKEKMLHLESHTVSRLQVKQFTRTKTTTWTVNKSQCATLFQIWIKKKKNPQHCPVWQSASRGRSTRGSEERWEASKLKWRQEENEQTRSDVNNYINDHLLLCRAVEFPSEYCNWND